MNGQEMGEQRQRTGAICWMERRQMIGTYADTYKKGCGVISENNFGKGKAYYVGTGLEPEVFWNTAW